MLDKLFDHRKVEKAALVGEGEDEDVEGVELDLDKVLVIKNNERLEKFRASMTKKLDG